MDGGEWMVVLLMIGLAVLGASRAWTWYRATFAPPPLVYNTPAPRLARIERPKLAVSPAPRDKTFATERTEIIVILLTAGKSPRFIARQLSGSTRYNRRRVLALSKTA